MRNLALEGKAQVQLLASLDKNKLNRVVDMYGYTVPEGTKRYASKPTYLNGAFTFNGQAEDASGEYFLINSQQFGKLILGNKGSCYGYEVYDYDGNSTAGLVSTVLDNQANVGMIVDSNGVRGSVVVEAINNQSSATISADKINLNGYVTVNSLKSGGSTKIDGSRITTGVIDSSNYSYNSGDFSNEGTAFNLSDGSILSKNFAIDADGNVYLRKNINIGLNSNNGYNFTVDSSGNVSVAGTLDAQVLKIKGENVLTGNKIASDYLELKGLTIKNDENQITFQIDKNGNVTLGGKSVITWNSIANAPTIPTLPSYLNESYISATTIYSPTIMANSFEITGQSNSGGKFTLFKLYVDGTTTVMTSSLTSAKLSFETMNISNSTTIFNGSNVRFSNGLTVDFTGATVTGLNATFG